MSATKTPALSNSGLSALQQNSVLFDHFIGLAISSTSIVVNRHFTDDGAIVFRETLQARL